MAKTLKYNYTFDASAQTIAISGKYTLRQLILITNVTDGAIIYNFADPGAGATISYTSSTNLTTISLEYNTTAMSDSDELQILIDDAGDTKIDAGESLIDPVHKFRVSNPQNLIDTDFEYGLQSSKWETIELVNNIPSVFARDSAVSIGEITQVDIINNTNSVTVTTGVDHGLSVGDPIEVRGTGSRTVDGKYLITAVPSTKSFKYRAGAIQNSTGNIKTAYTTIIPGSFFSNSDFNFDPYKGIETDGASPSELSIKTPSKHGLSANTSLYITNSVGKQEFTVTNTSSTAADGDTTINPTDNSIYLPSHNLYTGQRIFVSEGSGGSFPATETGAPTPSGSTTINTVYQACNTALTSVVNTLKSSYKNGTFYMRNSTSFRAYYNNFYSVNSLDPEGYLTTGHRQEMIYGEGNGFYEIVDYFKSGGGSTARYRWNTYGEGSELLFTGEPVDIGSFYEKDPGYLGTGPTNLSGHHWYQYTPYVNDSFVDYIVGVRQITAPSGYNIERFREFNARHRERRGNSSYSNGDSVDNSGSTWITPGDGWQYSYGVTRWTPQLYTGTGTSAKYRMGFLNMQIQLTNTSFDDYYSASGSSASSRYYNGQYQLDHSFFTGIGDHYKIDILIPYMGDPGRGGPYNDTFSSSSTSDTEYTYAQLASAVVNQVRADASHPSFASGTNTLQANVLSGDRISLKTDDTANKEFKLTSSGTGPIDIETETVTGVLDNYYTVTSVTDDTISIDGAATFAPRTLEFTNTDVITFNSEYYIYISTGHGLAQGQKVTFNLVSGSAISGLSSGTQYYAIVEDSKHLRLASNESDSDAGINAITAAPASTGSYNIQVYSISGTVSAIGLVSIANATTNTVTGTGTKFTTTFKVGDRFLIESTGATVNGYIIGIIAAIASDTALTLESPIGFAATNVNYFVDTKINVRADGTFLHRPFDGGVDITAGSSPDSSIVRQTRKYFRYQSGKGIQCSMAINFNPARPVRTASGSGTSITMTTEYPHGLSSGDNVKVSGASDSAYNGTYAVTSSTTFTFSYTSTSSVTQASPTGFIEYAIDGYSNAGIRAGLFDFQNGFFFEYDGSDLYAVRRSSVQQLSGTATVSYNSNIVTGLNTRFSDQLSAGDRIVIRGQTYKITSVESQTEIHMQPTYRGTSNSGVVITKTVDTKVAQSNWSIDKADGSGPSGYLLDINKIQMVYMDYSWYGAGKIRFGFKDTFGHVKYMHEFIHNNRLNEAYMRTGNVPARYEVFNEGVPTYIPSLFHWGTSVIMDGGFDDDDSYLFTASGKALTFTNGDADTATTTGASALYSVRAGFGRDYYVRLQFATSDASKFSTGIPLYTADDELDGEPVAFTEYGSGGAFYVYVYVSSGFRTPSVYPEVASGVTVNIGAETVGTSNVDLNSNIPLISVRLAPSVDNNLIGELGERDIINRMQLKLQELGISVSHDANISLILNGSLNNINYENVGAPSLTQYIAHPSGDTVEGGTVIYSFRASGGTEDSAGKRFVSSNAFNLSSLIDLGNSILGGNGVFPDGPDILTVACNVINTSEIDSTSSFQVASRISWAESQA